jgi:hypothetical protein
VSNRVELLSNGLRALERHALMGHLAFPIIDQGKGRGYMRERMKRIKRKSREEESPRVASLFFFDRWVPPVL